MGQIKEGQKIYVKVFDFEELARRHPACYITRTEHEVWSESVA